MDELMYYDDSRPSEAELKKLEAGRERTNKISSLMGKYLLKGYKMLGSSCDECGTVLLQDRKKFLYCVACGEVDTSNPDGSTENKAIYENTNRQKKEEPLQMSSSPQPSTSMTSLENSCWITDVENGLKSTLTSSVQNILNSSNNEDRIQLCTLVKVCAEAMIAVKSLKTTK